MIEMKEREGAQRERVIEERERDRERGNESKRLKERKVGKEREIERQFVEMVRREVEKVRYEEKNEEDRFREV